MAAPLKPDDIRRRHTLRVRVNDGEKALIERYAKNAGREVSDFMRARSTYDQAKTERVVPTPDREVLLKILAELGKIGSNVNQSARQLNRKQDSADLQGFDPIMLQNNCYAIDTLTKHLIDILTK